MLRLWVSLCLWFGLMGQVQAQVWVSRADIEAAGVHLQSVALPFFHEGGVTSLKHVSARYELQATPDQDKKFYGVMLPYPIQGGQIYLNGRLIHELEWSSASTLRSWYRPVMLNFSAHDLNRNGANWLEFRQTGHLRGWPVLPVLFGEIAQLRPVYDRVFYLTDTLAETINYLCAFVGVFLIATGLVGRQREYVCSGVAAVIWVLLFKMALQQELQADAWYLWRLTLYALTGNLILCLVLFLLGISHIRLDRRLGAGLVAACQLGWVVFLLWGEATEFYLDRYWVGCVVFLYVCSIVLTFRRTHLHPWFKPVFFGYLTISAVLAVHDFLFQAGIVFHFNNGLFSIFGNAVYLSHFTLPVFLWTSCLMLLLQYISSKQKDAQVRQEILNDIHDGVGARLNVLLMGLEMRALDWPTVKNDVRRCIDELRFVLLHDDEKTPFLFQLMEGFCADLSDRFEKSGIEFQYRLDSAHSSGVPPKVALVLYFALLECLSNVVKHASAGARTVHCALQTEAGRVLLQVGDDGPGIEGWSNEAQAFEQTDARRGLGLRSLFARVTGAGGRISVHSERGRHTRVLIDFPDAGAHPFDRNIKY